MVQFSALLRRFAKDESGVFAVLFGLMAIVLIALGGATVDYVTLEQARQRAQVALDSAVLALQPEIYQPGMSAESIRSRAEAIVLERIGDINLISAEVDEVSIDLEAGRLYLAGDFTLPTMFVGLVGVTQLSASFNAEAVRGAVDIEVSVALDITGSMGGQRITDLKAALNNLIDSIVQNSQTPKYSKMALIPYAQAVNAGSYATALRGPIRAEKNISSIAWTTGNTKSISNAQRNSLVRITSNGHGFSNGDWVYIWNVNGMYQINNNAYQVTNRTSNTFDLVGVYGSNVSNYNYGGYVVKCLAANCNTVITSANHGYSNGDWLYVTDVGGSTLGGGINGNSYQATNVTTNTLELAGYSMNGGSYTSNTGKLHCTWQTATQGCTYYRYRDTWGNYLVQPVTNCVTERATNPFNDQPPTATLVGRNYPPPGNGCPNQTILPLTSNKTTLHAAANALTAGGSTSGSLGTLWSWYMLSPNFGYVWPNGSQPAPYGQQNLLKAAIIMTDGDYNTVHCNGVVAQNSGYGSGGNQINCNAPNGDPEPQARAYCDAMKAKGIIVYTVGFGITAGSTQAQLLTYCASNANNAYLADNGAALASAFEQIARNISSLRLTR